MDWFVLLTPLLVLAVIALLGFTGCDLVFPLVAPTALTLEIKVPSQLTVNEAQFQFTQPGSGNLETTDTLERTDDGSGTVVLSDLVKNPALGSWAVRCRMTVQDGTGQATDTAVASFTLDEETPSGTAIFETSGRPATNNFKIVFTGLVAGG